MTENMEIWNALKQPPAEALKTIAGGRLKGFTDINPQYRYFAMTEQFGPCGEGWKYEIVKLWSEPGSQDQTFCFAHISLFVKSDGKWGEPIPGIGGSMLVAKEASGLYSSDEGYKMAVTDALSVALKMLGVAADIYAGKWDGSKYQDKPSSPKKEGTGDNKGRGSNGGKEMSEKQWKFIKKLGADESLSELDVIELVKWVAGKLNTPPRHWKVATELIPAENMQKQIELYNEHKQGSTAGDDIIY